MLNEIALSKKRGDYYKCMQIAQKKNNNLKKRIV